MIYAAIIYASGVVFFLAQAHIYARVTRERIIGALTWPMLIFAVSALVRAYMAGREEGGSGMVSFKIGDRWGIGA